MDDFKKMEDLVDHVRDYVHVRVDEAQTPPDPHPHNQYYPRRDAKE